MRYGVDVSNWTIPFNISVEDISLYGTNGLNSEETRARNYGRHRQHTETLYEKLDKFDLRIKKKEKQCKNL